MAKKLSFSPSRIAFLISMIFLAILSIITVSLQALTVAFILNPTAIDGSSVINFDLQKYPNLIALPQSLKDANIKLGLTSSVISLGVSLACVVFAVWAWPDGKRTYPAFPVQSLIYALVFNAMLSLIAMIYLLVAHSQSSIFDPKYRGISYLYDKDAFDFEAWACQISQYQSDFPVWQCGAAKVGRIADIICCVAAITAAIVGTRTLLRERKIIDQARMDKMKRDEHWAARGIDGDEVEIQQGFRLSSIIK